MLIIVPPFEFARRAGRKLLRAGFSVIDSFFRSIVNPRFRRINMKIAQRTQLNDMIAPVLVQHKIPKAENQGFFDLRT